MYIFGHQIRTVNMDRCHGSQISRAFSFLGLREHAFLVNEKKLIGFWRVIQIDRLFS